MTERPGVCVALSIDVEEEGLFGGTYPCRDVSIKNTAFLPRLYPLMEMGARPTLFCAYAAFADDASKKCLDKLRKRGGVEIGAHLHHWNTPPLYGMAARKASVNSVVSREVPLEIFEKKLRNVLSAGRDFTGEPMSSFRMGRWDLHGLHLPVLRRNGILCDASCRPLHHLRRQHGPDHFDAPPDPYLVPCPAGPLLEVPLTVIPILPLFKKIRARAPWGRALRSSLKNWGALALLPIEHPLELLCFTTKLHVKRGGRFLSLTWHSSEMMPGGAPHMPDEKAVSKFMTKMRNYLSWLHERYDVTYATMSEIRKGFMPAAIIPEYGGDWTYMPGSENNEF